MKNIKEDFLHYVWKTKNFDLSDLKLADGQDFLISSFGNHNDNAGPDFLNGQIEIQNTIWNGHIEIHVKSSDWLKHKHSGDANYQNVILHVVLYHDVEIQLDDGSVIPCLILENRINSKVVSQYHSLQMNQNWIPCENTILEMPQIIVESTKSRALAHRLEIKARDLHLQLMECDQDFQSLIFRRIAFAFGLKVNANTMLELAKSIPVTVVQKNRNNLLIVEALLFGQSGLLPDSSQNQYVNDLKREYDFLKHKYNLTPIPKVLWKFSRMRPSGFPTIRIAQLARYLSHCARYDDFLFDGSLSNLMRLLDIQLDGYWSTHYRFGTKGQKRLKSLGDASKSVIIINSFVPLLFMYGVIRQSQIHQERAILLLEQMKPEQNNITNRWNSLGLNNRSAADSQALLHLKKSFCDKHSCLLCPIGHQVMIKER